MIHILPRSACFGLQAETVLVNLVDLVNHVYSLLFLLLSAPLREILFFPILIIHVFGVVRRGFCLRRPPMTLSFSGTEFPVAPGGTNYRESL